METRPCFKDKETFHGKKKKCCLKGFTNQKVINSTMLIFIKEHILVLLKFETQTGQNPASMQKCIIHQKKTKTKKQQQTLRVAILFVARQSGQTAGKIDFTHSGASLSPALTTDSVC